MRLPLTPYSLEVSRCAAPSALRSLSSSPLGPFDLLFEDLLSRVLDTA
jgi:hypothetical protein